MKYWPVPDSYSKIVPGAGSPGSFWEDRGDRYHCGVDLYAAEMCDVVSVEDGKVMDIGICTSPEKIPYWNTTYYALVKNESGLLCRYTELGDVTVSAGEHVKAGHLIGNVGLILNSGKISRDSPAYIQKINEEGNQSMLHFELCKNPVTPITGSGNYLGGNWFGSSIPENLLDPTGYLSSTLRPL